MEEYWSKARIPDFLALVGLVQNCHSSQNRRATGATQRIHRAPSDPSSGAYLVVVTL